MNIQEKQAWYILGVLTLTLVGVVVAGLATGWHEASLGMLGMGGLAGFAPLIGRGKKRSGEIIMDERDLQISREATIIGYSVFWVLFVLAACGPMFVYGTRAMVEIRTGHLALSALLGMYAVFGVRSLATIILYRWAR
jgi:uncharacterized membrane protein